MNKKNILMMLIMLLALFSLIVSFYSMGFADAYSKKLGIQTGEALYLFPLAVSIAGYLLLYQLQKNGQIIAMPRTYILYKDRNLRKKSNRNFSGMMF